MKETFSSFKKSVSRLEEVLDHKKNLITRDAAIQRFEFTIELAWKCIQIHLRKEQIICRSPKSCFQEAFALGLIEDNEQWINMMDDRNLTVHTYDETLADDVYDRLESYLPLFKALSKTLEGKMHQSN